MNLKLPELTKDRKDIDWLWGRTLFLTRHGSHAYGTSTPTSDTDYKGFAIPPREYFLGYAKRFEQAEFRGDPDMVVYDLRKFFKLAADCNPSIIEVLFTDPSDWQLAHPLAARILQSRDLFLSRKAKHTFSGYAVSQLKKIKTHYRWLKNPPKAPPTRAEFGLPETTVIPKDQLQAAQSMIRKQVEAWNVPIDELDDAQRIAVQERFVEALTKIEAGQKARFIAEIQAMIQENETWTDGMVETFGPASEMASDIAVDSLGRGRLLNDVLTRIQGLGGANLERIGGQLLGFSDNFLELLDQERQYRGRMEEWRSYQTWLATRNEKRSALEAKYGYDTKHGMHLVRLMRMGAEILKSGVVYVRRPDAQELLEIRDGAWTYEYLLEWAQNQEVELDRLYEISPLPKSPPVRDIDKLLVSTVESGLEILP